MNRDDVLAALRKIMSTCTSFRTAQAVNVYQDKDTGDWALSVTWDPLKEEESCLQEILDEYKMEKITINGQLLFRSK